jgi:hypothetical protein
MHTNSTLICHSLLVGLEHKLEAREPTRARNGSRASSLFFGLFGETSRHANYANCAKLIHLQNNNGSLVYAIQIFLLIILNNNSIFNI